MKIKIFFFKESGKLNVVEEISSNREVWDTDGILETIKANYPIISRNNDFVFEATSDNGTELNCRLIKQKC